MSNENNNLQNEETNEGIDSEVISDISNCDNDGAQLSDEVGEERDSDTAPRRSPRPRRSGEARPRRPRGGCIRDRPLVRRAG